MDTWIEGIAKKRPDVFLVLHALVLHGLKHGTVTAEDAHCIPVSHPNCRGAAMKYLRKCGFERKAWTYGTTKKSHAHAMSVWECVSATKAAEFLNGISQQVITKPESHEQMELI